MNAFPSPPPSSSSSSNFTLFTHSKNPNYIFKFSIKVPILPLPCCTLRDSSSSTPVLDKNVISSEDSSSNSVSRRDSNLEGGLVVRRPMMEFSGDDSDEEKEQKKETGEDEKPKAYVIDAGLKKFAKKMPMFEPLRVESDSKEKPLTVNLDLALYRAKVLARKFQYEEAEAMLQKVW